MKRLPLCLGLVLLAVPARADQAPARVVLDAWDAAYLEGAKVGHFRTLIRETEVDGRKLYRATVLMDLAIKRYNAVVPLRMEVGSDETAEGKVVGLSLTQFLDKGKLAQSARVEDGKLVLRAGGETRELPWDDTVIGHYRQEQLFKEKKVKPGDRFHYRNYELSLLSPVTIRVHVKEPEEVDLLVPGKGGKAQRVKKRLVRVEATPDKITIGDTPVQLPKMTAWLDEARETVRSELDLPGLGKVTLYRTSKELAQAEGAAPALLPDLGLTTLIPLDRQIARPHDAKSITYRLTLDGDDDPATVFPRDARQQVRAVEGTTIELVVRALREPAAPEKPAKAPAEFLKPSHFIDSRDERVRELAAEAVGDETEPWAKARRIERWVHEHMRGNSAVGFVTASQVARDLEGDCRQHALLTAAMCRAAGVPARTAVGLVYVNDRERGPVLGFHMWTEVWVRGQWLALDATLGRGSVGPAHIRISSPSWNDTQTLAPLLPVTRVMGKLKAEVVGVKR